MEEQARIFWFMFVINCYCYILTSKQVELLFKLFRITIEFDVIKTRLLAFYII